MCGKTYTTQATTTMTRDPDRIDEVLDELEDYWKDNPDLRLGQIVGNAALRRGYSYRDPYHMDDNELLTYLKAKNDGTK